MNTFRLRMSALLSFFPCPHVAAEAETDPPPPRCVIFLLGERVHLRWTWGDYCESLLGAHVVFIVNDET